MHAQNVLACSQEHGFKTMEKEDHASEESFRKLKYLSYWMAGHEQVRVRIRFVFAFGKRTCNRLIKTVNFQYFLNPFFGLVLHLRL